MSTLTTTSIIIVIIHEFTRQSAVIERKSLWGFLANSSS